MATRIDELRHKFEENPRRYFAPLANEYRKAGKLREAIALCREQLAQQPTHMSGYVVLGQAFFENGQLDDARVTFEKALSLDPENLIALRHLGDIARTQGDAETARRWYARVLDADPRNDDIAAQLASLADRSGYADPGASYGTQAGGYGDYAGGGYGETYGGSYGGYGGYGQSTSEPYDPYATPGSPSAPPSAPQPAPAPGAGPSRFEPLEDFDELLTSALGAPAPASGDAPAAAAAEPLAEEPPAPARPATPAVAAPAMSRDLPPVVRDGPLPSTEIEEAEFSVWEVPPVPADAAAASSAAAKPGGERAAEAERHPVVGLDVPPAAGAAVTDAGAELLAEADVVAAGASTAAAPGVAAPDAAEPVDGPIPPFSELIAPVLGEVPRGTGEPLEPVAPEHEGELPAAVDPAFATATMAELYVQQGHLEQAIDVFRQLTAAEPGDSVLADRLAELEARVAADAAAALDASADEELDVPDGGPTLEFLDVPAGSGAAAPEAAASAPEAPARSAGSFFASLASRGGAAPGGARSAAAPFAEPVTAERRPTPPAPAPATPTAPFVTGGGPVSPADERAAAALSGAFDPDTEARLGPSLLEDLVRADLAAAGVPAPPSWGAPPPPPPAAPRRDDPYSFDRFFVGLESPATAAPAPNATAPAPSGAPPAPASPSMPTTSGGADAELESEEDLAEFHEWLKGLRDA